MSEQLRESLSAAMDGEADAFELRRVLDEAGNDAALREQWHRFHVLRDHLRDSQQTYDSKLREAVHAALNEPENANVEVAELVLADTKDGKPTQRSAWLGRLGGAAVAAAVAVVVMVNGGVFEQEPAEFANSEFSTPEFASVQPASSAAPQAVLEPVLEPVLYQQATDIDKQRQHALMLHHIQQRAMNQASMTSFVKLATFDSARPAINRMAPNVRTESAQALSEDAATQP